MRNIVLFLCCMCMLLSGCGKRNKSTFIVDSNQLHNTDSVDFIEEDYDDPNMLYLLDFEYMAKNMPPDTFTINSIAKNITLIPLETTRESLLQVFSFQIAKIDQHYYISSGRVSAGNFAGIMKFDTTGHYINHLMMKEFGNGPTELPNFLLNWTSNNHSKVLVASTHIQILLHTFDDSTTNKYKLTTDAHYECLLNDGTMVSLPSPIGYKGSSEIPYMHFRNQESEIIHSFYYPQKRDFTNEIPERDGGGVVSSYSLHPHYTGDALFKDIFNDTIYRIRSMHDIKPYMILHEGSLAATSKDATNATTRDAKLSTNRILDTKKYFFIRYRYRKEYYTSIWDKKTLTLIANTKIDSKDENEKMLSRSFDSCFFRYIMPNGKKILLTSKSYYDGILYAVLDAEDAMEFLPGIVYDDNPILMIIDIG